MLEGSNSPSVAVLQPILFVFCHMVQFFYSIMGRLISWKAFSLCELTFASPSVINRANVGQSGMGDGQQGIG